MQPIFRKGAQRRKSYSPMSSWTLIPTRDISALYIFAPLFINMIRYLDICLHKYLCTHWWVVRYSLYRLCGQRQPHIVIWSRRLRANWQCWQYIFSGGASRLLLHPLSRRIGISKTYYTVKPSSNTTLHLLDFNALQRSTTNTLKLY